MYRIGFRNNTLVWLRCSAENMERHTPTNTDVKPHRIGAFDKLFKEENIDDEDRQYA